ncbi:hypothetical protein A8709_22425 [Paenibacillus pectinilyticus]|uniref:Transposase zinc-ribbon domain-containing protein n=1 Tax=Paenibacillus pectinilyticus TaxID=512399 RepID=A0A1C0ZRB1_9BACL|nr:transposase [Paenibacillus pectinilyticus]OCT10602.1 hypothetical protein A8709_22425 [Paenibacillus pectinilyticus]
MEMLLVESLENTFQTEEDCEQFLIKNRWSNGFFCPRCDHHIFYKVKTRNLLECKECRTQISITAGTVMHKSKLSLLLWFKAIRIILQDEMTYTVAAFANLLGVNYRTARLLLEKLQFALEKRYARSRELANPTEETEILNNSEEGLNGRNNNINKHSAKNMRNTSALGRFLFMTARKVKHTTENVFKKWGDAFFSVYLYPYVLRYFQVR